MKKAGRSRQLKWSMIKMLAAGWFLPFLLISIMLLFFVSKRMDRQLQNTIMTSADKSIELCELRLKQAMESSKEASYQPMLKEGYARYLQDGDDVKLNRTASNFIIQHYRVNTDFNLTYLYFIHDPENACMTYQDYYDAKAFMDYALEEVMELSRDLDTSIVFVNIHGRMYMVRNIVDSNFRPFAVLTMELNVEDMFGGLRAIWGFHEGDVFIDDVSVFGVYEEDPCLTLIEEKDMEKPHYYHRGEKAYIYMRLDSGWHKTAYAVTLDESVIAGETVVLRYLLIMLAVFMIPLIIVVFVFFHQSVNKPIGALRDAYKEIEKEHYGFHVKTDTRHEEFADLDEAFNSMSDKLQYQFEKIYLEELALRDANIMALQSQINPHFLNNTLEIINWEARMAENYKISAMIESLSTMLEATMNRGRKQLIPLSEEMSYAEAYLYIISRRFGEKLSITKEIDENCLQVMVPRLIVQPILENAIEHGVNFAGKGKIRIRISREKDRLFIEVMNNGKLTDKDREKIAQLLGGKDVRETRSVSLGIRNVNKRLKLLYGGDCGLTIKSDKDGYTVSTIIVKIDNKGEQ
ncbi:MAG: sensor histidine kinase [Lachnospiraceae bacterium]|nr:sensor histidine kinase [Lachnospiraceae bacterium]